jgi:hypothetical protein
VVKQRERKRTFNPILFRKKMKAETAARPSAVNVCSDLENLPVYWAKHVTDTCGMLNGGFCRASYT